MGRDRGKFNKRGGRGGGRGFQATSADEIELRNSRVAQFDAARAKRRADADDEKEGGDDDEVLGTEEEISQGIKAMKVEKKKEAVAAAAANSEPRPETRKEREEKEKERKAADYRRRHELGLTEEYRLDMAKLAEVKKRREDAAQRASAEKEVETELEKEIRAERVAAEKNAEAEEGRKKKSSRKKKGTEVPKLDKIAIKKMKPTQLKEALKLRKLEIQGNSKALTERLLAYEAAR